MKNLSALLVLSFPILVSCATTRVVSVKPRNGGVIAISQGLFGAEEARTKAERMMRSNCGGAFEITEESEAVIGTTSHTQGSAQENKKNWSQSVTQSSSTTDTTNKTEWRLTYVCKR